MHLDGCHRYNGGYAFQLQAELDGQRMDENKLHACSGDKSAQIQQQAKDHMDGTIDLATVSLGGNDVLFANIVNDCVYRFNGIFAGNCDSTLAAASQAINELEGKAKDTLSTFMEVGGPDSH